MLIQELIKSNNDDNQQIAYYPIKMLDKILSTRNDPSSPRHFIRNKAIPGNHSNRQTSLVTMKQLVLDFYPSVLETWM
jgi:hypothetical protein